MSYPSSVPTVVFKTRVRDESVEGGNPFRWQDLSSSEIFAGKKVVVFSLPGALHPYLLLQPPAPLRRAL